MPDVIIGVDLGGTQMRAARFDSDLTLLERVAEPTLAHQGFDRVMSRLKEVIARVMPEDRSTVRGLGISVPGPVNPHLGTVVAPPNLPGWHNVPVQQIMRDHFGVETFVGNDANVAALAEATRGAAQGYKFIAYITVSTGIGSGIIDNGHLVLGADGLGAEVGHIPLVVENGRVSQLETEAAGPGIARQAVEALRAGAESQIRALVNGNLDAVTAKEVGAAALAGDPLAVSLIRRAGFMVGLGIVTLMHLFNPQIFVIGGGVTHTGDLLFEPMREAARQYTMDPSYWQNVPIVPAALGDNVALIGAAALVATRGGSQVG